MSYIFCPAATSRVVVLVLIIPGGCSLAASTARVCGRIGLAAAGCQSGAFHSFHQDSLESPADGMNIKRGRGISPRILCARLTRPRLGRQAARGADQAFAVFRPNDHTSRAEAPRARSSHMNQKRSWPGAEQVEHQLGGEVRRGRSPWPPWWWLALHARRASMPRCRPQRLLGRQRRDLADRADHRGLAHAEASRDEDLGGGDREVGQRDAPGKLLPVGRGRGRSAADRSWLQSRSSCARRNPTSSTAAAPRSSAPMATSSSRFSARRCRV